MYGIHQLPAVGGDQHHTLTNLLSFCDKTSSSRKTQALMPASSTKPKGEGEEQGNQEEEGQ
jgi:hypothetical protein